MVRVLHCLPGIASKEAKTGVETVAYYLAKAQAELGHEVAVLSQHPKSAERVPGVRAETFLPPLNRLSLPRDFTRAIESFEPDVVHLHNAFSVNLTLLMRWLQRNKTPYVVAPHGALHRQGAFKFRKWLYHRLIQKPDLSRALFLHVIASAENDAVQNIKVPKVFVPNGVSTAAIPEDLDRNFLRRRYPELRRKRIFMYLGRLNCNEKGTDLLLRSFAKAKSKNIALVLVGPFIKDQDRHEVLSLAKSLNAERNIHFLGPVTGEQKFHYLGGADVFIQTSRFEGMPVTVLEAAACGLPSITSPAASLDGNLARCAGGVEVPLQVPAIVDAIDKFSGLQTQLLREMGSQARELIIKEYSWERRARALLVAYTRHLQPSFEMAGARFPLLSRGARPERAGYAG